MRVWRELNGKFVDAAFFDDSIVLLSFDDDMIHLGGKGISNEEFHALRDRIRYYAPLYDYLCIYQGEIFPLNDLDFRLGLKRVKEIHKITKEHNLCWKYGR